MKHPSSVIVLIIVPMYVLSVFVAEVFAPTNEMIPSQEPLVLQFVGDMMFDRYIRERAEVHGYDAILEGVRAQLQNSDVLVGNIEGPITTFAPVADWRIQNADHYRFTFATTVAKTLRDAGFTTVTLANNHMTNFGTEGYNQTIEWLEANDIGYFGEMDDPYKPWRYTKGSSSVSLYAFDSWYARDVDEITSRIQNEQQGTFVVVYAHWGDEYEVLPNEGQRLLARQFIDAGADFVVGTHPHVIQTKEKYKHAWIYYSLGNFVFDQYFSAQVRCGAGVTVHLDTPSDYTVEEFFVELSRDGTTKESACGEVAMDV